MIAIALLAVVGLDAAALIAGPKQYFTYYTNKQTGYQFKYAPKLTFNCTSLSRACTVKVDIQGPQTLPLALLNT